MGSATDLLSPEEIAKERDLDVVDVAVVLESQIMRGWLSDRYVVWSDVPDDRRDELRERLERAERLDR